MDTPTIAEYYRESDPKKRKALLEQEIEAGTEPEANQIQMCIRDRYGTDEQNGRYWQYSEYASWSGK